MTEATTDIERLRQMREAALDQARPEAVQKIHDRGRWMARERIDALVDEGTFVEYGMLATPPNPGMAGPADGIVLGHAQVEGRATCVVSYDYSVYAGSQSKRNHTKLTRILRAAEQSRWPVVIWAEGGGARPQDMMLEAERNLMTDFTMLARLSGNAPVVAVVPGRSFAGHAAFVAMAECVIATKNGSMGIAGSGMLVAATGERLTPEQIGPADLHESTGNIDLLVEDEAATVAAVRQYLSYFDGKRHEAGPARDQAGLRTALPANPRRAYDVRKVIDVLADEGSVFEMRPKWARNLVTSLIRIGGYAVGVIANQPNYLAGAIDAHASDKLARFAQLCDAYDIPILMLCDTPGFLAGRESEEIGTVRHSGRTALILANRTVPILTVMMRKAYGLAYYIMGSTSLEPVIIVAWPTAEFGGMGIEGAVNMLYAKDLDAAATPEERAELHKRKTDEIRFRNTAFGYGERFIVDDVIDPADTRAILIRTLDALPPVPARTAKKHFVDAW